MRLAAYTVENLFDRPKPMNLPDRPEEATSDHAAPTSADGRAAALIPRPR
jgi:hypothetical protein